MEIKDIEKLSELAKIKLTDSEKKELLKDVGNILEYVKVIEKVEVLDEEVKYDNKNVWREDEEREWDYDKNLIIDQFPDSEDGYLKVKKIL